MQLWIDAQLSPAIALWINKTFPEIEAKSSNEKLRTIFSFALPKALWILEKNDNYVEISDNK